MKDDPGLYGQLVSLLILSLLTACSADSGNTDVAAGTDTDGLRSSDSSIENNTDSQDSVPTDSEPEKDSVESDIDSSPDTVVPDSETASTSDSETASPPDSETASTSDSETASTSDSETASPPDSETANPPDSETESPPDSETSIGTDESDWDTFLDTVPLDSETSGDTETHSIRCSPDLHSLVDESGNIIETCPSDQGCLGGICVPACTAAAAAHGNIGCDFLIPRPPIAMYDSPCFAAFVANNWNKPAAVNLSREDTTYDVGSIARVPVTGQTETSWPLLPVAGVPVEQVAVLFLEGGPLQYLGCPVQTAVDTGTAISMTGRGRAWRITTDTPVTVYDIMPYGGADSFAPSAELVFPTSSWKTNYLAVVPPFQPFPGGSGNPGSQWGQITAYEDNTVVSIAPSVDLPSGTDVPAAPTGIASSFSLSAGEVLQWKQNWSTAVPMDMTGSVISANRPVSFAGGNEYLCIQTSTSDGGGCDAAHQQIPPINAWGGKYAAAPFATRIASGADEALLYRIVGAKNDTTLTFNPPIAGAPSSLEQGEQQDFEVTGAFTVESQDGDHPFYIAQMMSGWIVTGSLTMLGDEEYVNLVPSAQFMSSYVFFTDLTYETTSLTLTQCDEGAGFKDVYLRCLDNPVQGWQPIGSSAECRWTTVDLVRGGIGNGDCRNGPQFASSDGTFGLMVWGMDNAASYAYPAGALVSQINDVEIPVI